MKTWVEAGLDPSRFWKLTHRELDVILQGANARLQREHDARAWLAWHTAYLTVYAPEKSRRFPKLERLTRPKRSAAPQTVPEMIAIAIAWDRQLNQAGKISSPE